MRLTSNVFGSYGASIYSERVVVTSGFNVSFNIRFGPVTGPADVVYLALYQSSEAAAAPLWSCAPPANAGGLGCFTANARVIVELVTYQALVTAAAANGTGFAGTATTGAAFSPLYALSGAGSFGASPNVAAGDLWSVSVSFFPLTASSGLIAWSLTRGAQSASFSTTLNVPDALNAAPSTGDGSAWLGFAGACGGAFQEAWVTDVLWQGAPVSPTPTPSQTPTQTKSASPSQVVTSSTTQTVTPTQSVTPTQTVTPSQALTLSQSQSLSLSQTPTQPMSATGSGTSSQVSTLTETSTQAPTRSPTLSASGSGTISQSTSQAATLSVTSTQVVSAGSTQTPSQRATPTATGTLTRSPASTDTASLSRSQSSPSTRAPTPSTSESGSGSVSQTGSTIPTSPRTTGTPSGSVSSSESSSSTSSWMQVAASSTNPSQATATRLQALTAPPSPSLAAVNGTVAAGGGQPTSSLGVIAGSSAAGSLLFLVLLVVLLVIVLRRRRSAAAADEPKALAYAGGRAVTSAAACSDEVAALSSGSQEVGNQPWRPSRQSEQASDAPLPPVPRASRTRTSGASPVAAAWPETGDRRKSSEMTVAPRAAGLNEVFGASGWEKNLVVADAEIATPAPGAGGFSSHIRPYAGSSIEPGLRQGPPEAPLYLQPQRQQRQQHPPLAPPPRHQHLQAGPVLASPSPGAAVRLRRASLPAQQWGTPSHWHSDPGSVVSASFGGGISETGDTNMLGRRRPSLAAVASILTEQRASPWAGALSPATAMQAVSVQPPLRDAWAGFGAPGRLPGTLATSSTVDALDSQVQLQHRRSGFEQQSLSQPSSGVINGGSDAGRGGAVGLNWGRMRAAATMVSTAARNGVECSPPLGTAGPDFYHSSLHSPAALMRGRRKSYG